MPDSTPSPTDRRLRNAPKRAYHWLAGKPAWFLYSLAFVVLLLLGLRLAAPYIAVREINQILAGMPDYRGHADSVTLHLWRGAYRIHGLRLDKIEKKNPAKPPEPFIDLPLTKFSIEWSSLLHGALVGKVILEQPRLNLIDSPVESEKQLTISESWGDKFQKIFPLRINRLEIRNGQLSFKNPRSTPPVDLQLTELQVVGTDLTNRPPARAQEALAGHVSVTARVLKTAKLESHVEINPTASKPDFHLTLQLKDGSFPEMNNFLKAYANVDAESGHFEAYSELRVRNGQMDGYLKPIVQDPSFVKFSDLGEHPIRFAWETAVSTILFFFTNHAHDEWVATRIPLTGSTDHPDIDYFSMILGLIENAYLGHIEPGLDKKPELKP